MERNAPAGGRVGNGVDRTARSAGSRSDQAFAEFVVPEIEVLLRVARSLTGRSADAEDLVQDTLLRAYRSIDSFDGRHPRAWLLTILRNTHINRNRRRRPVLLDDPDADLDRLAATPAAGETTEGLALGSQFDAAIEDAFNRLPDHYRQVVALVDVQGLSYAEAAEALALPLGTVMSRLHRARSRMRKRLVGAGLAPRRQM
ncbi:MAG: sigma-70 family RNA polymerase sigma factor [Acidobacteriota bacterium]|nr:sigma-70 family RNA polymerase sigma factor [Acidobacteriota bacterium]